MYTKSFSCDYKKKDLSELEFNYLNQQICNYPIVTHNFAGHK